MKGRGETVEGEGMSEVGGEDGVGVGREGGGGEDARGEDVGDGG